MNFEEFQKTVSDFFSQMASVITGQEDVYRFILMAYIAGGHVLLEGVPGLAKTLTIKTFADVVGNSFKRIQFTPDLLPSDLIGTLIFQQGLGKFAVRKGPLFANTILADEINRAPAKVQSALLEAMAEHQVTIGENSYELPKPFFVLATQNPIEQDGTYPLPEAELDRFLLKLSVPYPSHSDEVHIVKTISEKQLSDTSETSTTLRPVFTQESLAALRSVCASITIDDSLTDYIVSLVEATRPIKQQTISEKDFLEGSYLTYITVGASPRASIALQVCAKIEAAFQKRTYVNPSDIKKVAYPVLRHRLKLSYEAVANNMTADSIIEKILSIVPQP